MPSRPGYARGARAGPCAQAMIHVDTSFLVDLLRESRRRRPGPATAFLNRIQGEELRVDVHVACELLAGAEFYVRPSVERSGCSACAPSCRSHRFPPTYARLLASLERKQQRIATMDLLITTAAVVDGAALVTRNPTDFSRITGLGVVAY